MDPDSRALLEETYALARDNHNLLRTIRRHQILMDFGKFFMWLLILAASLGIYQVYLRPLIGSFEAGGLSGVTGSMFGGTTTTGIGKLLESVGGQ